MPGKSQGHLVQGAGVLYRQSVRILAGCTDFQNPRDCRKFNNWIAKIFGLIFRSDRAACIGQIRRIGIEGHAAEMAVSKRQTIKKS